MLFALIVVIMLGIAAFDMPPMIKHGQWKEIRAYSVLWIVGIVLGILQAAGVALPNPTTIIVNSMPLLVDAVAALLGL